MKAGPAYPSEWELKCRKKEGACLQQTFKRLHDITIAIKKQAINALAGVNALGVCDISVDGMTITGKCFYSVFSKRTTIENPASRTASAHRRCNQAMVRDIGG